MGWDGVGYWFGLGWFIGNGCVMSSLRLEMLGPLIHVTFVFASTSVCLLDCEVGWKFNFNDMG